MLQICSGTVNNLFVYYKAEFHSGSLRWGSTSQGLTKHLLVLFVCNELCLTLHNLCSGGHVTEGETEGEREMKTKLKEDKEHLSFAAFPLLFPSQYFGNKLNPVLDYKLLDVMWISIKVSARAGITSVSARLKYQLNRVRVSFTFTQKQWAVFLLMGCVVCLCIILCVTMPGSFQTGQ